MKFYKRIDENDQVLSVDIRNFSLLNVSLWQKTSNVKVQARSEIK